MKLICGIRTVGMNPKTRKEDKVHAHIYLFFIFSMFLNRLYVHISYVFFFLFLFGFGILVGDWWESNFIAVYLGMY